MSTKQKRAYERRRQEQWQQRQSARAAARRRRLRVGVVIFAAVLVVAVAAVGAILVTGGDDESGAVARGTVDEPRQIEPRDPADVPTFDAAPDPATAEGRTWTASISTSEGDVTVELHGDQAPQTVASFLQLARGDFYTDTPCHRLTTQGIFVLQCGDPTGTGTGGPGYSYGPIENAPADDIYPAGTLAMARQGGNGESQGSQFFLVYEDSTIPSDVAGGYTVFGTVTDGLDTVTQVAADGVVGGSGDGQPARAIRIEQVTVQ